MYQQEIIIRVSGVRVPPPAWRKACKYGSASGIRWVVGDIDLAARGVAAGKTPKGGIVGSDTQGHSGYGGICPAHGKTSTIEFVLYALRKKIPLSPRFAPSTAESEYGSSNDLLGSAAVTYAGARGGGGAR